MLLFIICSVIVPALCIRISKPNALSSKIEFYVGLTTVCLFWLTAIVTIFITEVVTFVERGTVEYYQKSTPILVQSFSLFICEVLRLLKDR